MAVDDKRPVNLDLSTIKLPLPAVASILHRISGVFLFVGIAVLLYMLDVSLESAESFAALQALLQSVTARFLVWLILAGLIYHSVAGVKHLLMDVGVGETLEGGMQGAKIVFVVSAVLIVMVGVWLW
jgi:succinate dehydrogenase / fumarate reductase cytochrome b subunit